MMLLRKSGKRLEFEAIGTSWRIDFTNEIELVSIEKLVLDRIAAFDKAYSRFRGDSLIAKLFDSPGKIKLPADAPRMIEVYQKIYSLTDGKVTPLIGNVLEDAGYDRRYSFENGELYAPPPLEEVVLFSAPYLTLKRRAVLDFGAAGKGYLVDIVGGILEENGIDQYTVDAGGDILHRGNKIRIGLENPKEAWQAIGIVELGSRSICSSSGNRRSWGEYHHIIDPKLLKSSDKILASWVISDTTIEADIIATSLFFVEPDKLKEEFDFEYLILHNDMRISKSDDFDAEIFTA